MDSRTRFPATLAALPLMIGLLSAAHAADTDDRYLVHYQPGSKASVLAALPPGASVHHEFDRIRVLAVSMPAGDADALAALNTVLEVAEDPEWILHAQSVPYGIDMVQARDTWDADRDGTVDDGAATGSGINVCIVDTGIYAAHEDLGGGGVNILAGRSWVGEAWDEDRQGHGTHVAGTVAAMNNDTGVVGVSPGQVNLIIADVFNDAGESQQSSTILDAANWCVDQDADIISMSLGGIGVNLFADAYRHIYDAGVLVIAASGNDSAPVSSFPASYDSVVSVGAVDSTETRADFSNFPPEVEVSAPGVAVLSSYPFENSLVVGNGPSYMANSIANASSGDLSGEFTGPLADGGDCNTAPAPGAYDGQIVLCERGGATFGIKIDNAAAGGATGAVIYNNAAGNFSGTYGDPCCSPIPAISLSQSDGQDALSRLGASSTMVVEAESVRGYAELSGTSMATPHASGVAAVQWSACHELTNDQVRSHLTATVRDAAGDLTPGLRDPEYGYGLVQVKAGVDALSDGVDEYDAASGNADGNNPANAECPATEPPAGGASYAHGAGQLDGNADPDDDARDKINFNFDARVDGNNVASGRFALKDKVAGAAIEAMSVASLQQLTQACGPVEPGSNAVEITADGWYNDQPASFRLCASDVAQSGKDNDRLYLECTSGCSYSTAASGSNGVLRAGNVRVRIAGAGASGGDDAGVSTVALGPLLLDGTTAGALQVLSADVRSGSFAPVAGTTVTLETVNADGSIEYREAVTGANGKALFTVVLANGETEYRATADSLQSNSVEPAARD